MFLTLLCTIIPLAFAHDEDVYTVKYTTENFSEVPKKNHFLMFYAPWCGHCQKFSPTWEQLAEMLNQDDNNIKIGKVDCTTDAEICSEQDVTGYPTLKFFKIGDTSGERFRGTRDLPSLTTFINEQLREGEAASEASEIQIGGLFELNEDNFDQHVTSGKHFVKFYAPWCGHCQFLAPTWEKLAKSLENEEVNIGKIDCTKFRSICNTFEIKGYPTLLWIENGKKLDKYQGDRSLEDLRQFVVKMQGSSNEVPEDSQENNTPKVSTGELTTDNFKEGILHGITFVKFYAPWCGHCKRLSPTWDSLRQKFAARNEIDIVKVDCNTEENKQLCNDEEVEGFPTLFLYKDGQKISEYSGSRSLEDLFDFVNKHVGHDEL